METDEQMNRWTHALFNVDIGILLCFENGGEGWMNSAAD